MLPGTNVMAAMKQPDLQGCLCRACDRAPALGRRRIRLSTAGTVAVKVSDP